MNYDVFAYLRANKEQGIHNGNWSRYLPVFIIYAGGQDFKKLRLKEAEILKKQLLKSAKNYHKVLMELGLEQLPDLKKLPVYSFYINLKFKLVKPYISLDDEALYPIDNPVRKDKVFKIPMISPSTWKGHLRSAIKAGQDNEPVISRLLGGEKNDEELIQGRIIFYPTFFTNVCYEVINPHDRKKKAGRNPVFFESVPEGEDGKFTLLYVPQMALYGTKPGTKDFMKQMKDDMAVLLKGIEDMMLIYGFSAKKTSGYGAAEDKLATPGNIAIHFPQREPVEQEVKIFNINQISELSELAEKIWPNGGGNNEFLP